jgi:molybdate transport system permease protein
MSDLDLDPIWLTLRLALTATPLLLAIGTPLAWWLARTTGGLRHPIEAVVALPLVLPPTVLGFYLLLLLGPHGAVGAAWQALGFDLPVFSFSGLVIGSVLYSLPFVVQPLQVAFEGVGRRPLEAAATLGAGPLDRFVTVAVPLARRGFLTAGTLGFAHTLGEFGVVLMIGGNIPGRTRVLSIAIYDHVERLEYAQAHRLSLAMLIFSFLVLWAVYVLNRGRPRPAVSVAGRAGRRDRREPDRTPEKPR